MAEADKSNGAMSKLMPFIRQAVREEVQKTINESTKQIIEAMVSENQQILLGQDAFNKQIEILTQSIQTARPAKPKTTTRKTPAVPATEDIVKIPNVNIYFADKYSTCLAFRKKYTPATVGETILKRYKETTAEFNKWQKEHPTEPTEAAALTEWKKTHDKLTAKFKAIGRDIYKLLSSDEKKAEKDRKFTELFKTYKDEHKNAKASMEEEIKKNNRPTEKEVEAVTDEETT